MVLSIWQKQLRDKEKPSRSRLMLQALEIGGQLPEWRAAWQVECLDSRHQVLGGNQVLLRHLLEPADLLVQLVVAGEPRRLAECKLHLIHLLLEAGECLALLRLVEPVLVLKAAGICHRK